MPKLASSTQSKLISYRREEKPLALDHHRGLWLTSRISPVQDLHPYSRLGCSSILTSRVQDLDPEAYCSWIQTRSRRRKQACGDDLKGEPARDGLFSSSLQIPIWGAKRARSARVDLLSDDDRRNRVSLLPFWRAKQKTSPLNLRYDYIPASAPLSDHVMLSDKSVWRDWTNVGEGPAGLIAERLLADDVVDYICFRAVCRQWRLCSTDPRAHGVLDRRFHPRQWIMLREEEISPYRRRFLNTVTGCCARCVDLPELDGQDVFGPTTEGLLVLLDRATSVVRLLNPLTRQMADLPPASTLITSEHLKHLYFMKDDLLQVSGAGLADNFTIAVYFKSIRTLAIAKPGDAHWVVVDRGDLGSCCLRPAMSFEGRFYCANNEAVMVVETSADQQPRLVIAAKLARPFARIMMDTVHLVDNDGKLILVDRERNGNQHRKFEVYHVDLVARKMVPIRGLGGRAVFIGMELALSVSPSVFRSICADAIYLGFDKQMTGRLDRTPIHLMDGTTEPRQYYQDSIDDMPVYEPLRVDDYLAWCVTGYCLS